VQGGDDQEQTRRRVAVIARRKRGKLWRRRGQDVAWPRHLLEAICWAGQLPRARGRGRGGGARGCEGGGNAPVLLLFPDRDAFQGLHVGRRQGCECHEAQHGERASVGSRTGRCVGAGVWRDMREKMDFGRFGSRPARTPDVCAMRTRVHTHSARPDTHVSKAAALHA